MPSHLSSVLWKQVSHQHYRLSDVTFGWHQGRTNYVHRAEDKRPEMMRGVRGAETSTGCSVMSRLSPVPLTFPSPPLLPCTSDAHSLGFAHLELNSPSWLLCWPSCPFCKLTLILDPASASGSSRLGQNLFQTEFTHDPGALYTLVLHDF